MAVKASKLIGGASYDPATLQVLYKVFDAAWERVAPGVSGRAAAVEAARLKLAQIVLALGDRASTDAGQLTDEAVRLMRSDRAKGRS